MPQRNSGNHLIPTLHLPYTNLKSILHTIPEHAQVSWPVEHASLDGRRRADGPDVDECVCMACRLGPGNT